MLSTRGVPGVKLLLRECSLTALTERQVILCLVIVMVPGDRMQMTIPDTEDMEELPSIVITGRESPAFITVENEKGVLEHVQVGSEFIYTTKQIRFVIITITRCITYLLRNIYDQSSVSPCVLCSVNKSCLRSC